MRTPHRKDLAVPPPDGNLLAARRPRRTGVVSIGKIGDIFAHRDTGRKGGRARATTATSTFCLKRLKETHRRRPHLRQSGRFRHRMGPSARCSRLRRLPRGFRPSVYGESKRRCGRTIIALITADHGNDPTYKRLRPHPRARADRRLRRRRAGRTDRRGGRASPTSPRPSRSSSDCRGGHTGMRGQGEVALGVALFLPTVHCDTV